MRILVIGNKSCTLSLFMKKLEIQRKELDLPIKAASCTLRDIHVTDILVLTPNVGYIKHQLARFVKKEEDILVLHHFDYASLNPTRMLQEIQELSYTMPS